MAAAIAAAAPAAPGDGALVCGAPLLRRLDLFDAGGNLLLSRRWGSTLPDLPFAVASLPASLAAYAADGGLDLEEMELEACCIRFCRCAQAVVAAGCACSGHARGGAYAGMCNRRR